jgi:hypothetical protein
MKAAMLQAGSARRRANLKSLARVVNERTMLDLHQSVSKIAGIVDIFAVVGAHGEHIEDACNSATTALSKAADANFTTSKELSVLKACLGRRECNGRFKKGNLSPIERAGAFLHLSVLGRSEIDFEQHVEKGKPLITQGGS